MQILANYCMSMKGGLKCTRGSNCVMKEDVWWGHQGLSVYILRKWIKIQDKCVIRVRGVQSAGMSLHVIQK